MQLARIVTRVLLPSQTCACYGPPKAMNLSPKALIAVSVTLALVVGTFAVYAFLPRRYSVAVRLQQVTVFWNTEEAFFFLNTSSSGRTQTAVLDRLPSAPFGYWSMFFGGLRFMAADEAAYHLSPSGDLTEVELPSKPALSGDWTLQDGQLQLNPISGGANPQNGFRWDGSRFVLVPPRSVPKPRESSTLDPDDDDDDVADPGSMSRSSRKAFRAAGWHYKVLNAYDNRSTEAVLPIALAESSFQLSVLREPLPPATDKLNALSGGIHRVELSGAGRNSLHQSLWTNRGWQPVSKQEFEDLARRSGRPLGTSGAVWGWLAVFALLTISKIAGWSHLAWSWLGLKKRVLNDMATAYSFPPATPSQFPQLDTAELERYSREFESYGFIRLLDFSLVSNASRPIPSFCRLFAHTRHHCFAELSQVFLLRKTPLPLRCSIQSSLEDGWTLGFSDRKPQAASCLLRRKKAVSISMPGTTTYELLQRFLLMRDQICQDLGIACLKDDTLDAYISKVQRAASEMHDAVERSKFVTRIPEVYYRNLALLKTNREYVWLGDYPKEAELRKQGSAVPVLVLK